jgi:hypothetical protein
MDPYVCLTICIVNYFYFIVVLTARTCTFFNTTQHDAKHKDNGPLLVMCINTENNEKWAASKCNITVLGSGMWLCISSALVH